jgi:hypothetical protein
MLIDSMNNTQALVQSDSSNKNMVDANTNATQSSSSPPSSTAAYSMKPLAASPNRTRLPFAFAPPAQPFTTPASSQIFERNVQESAVPSELSPAIPAHIQTEHHIPPVLEASSLAITDTQLDPDHVEIVTHTAHQPASEKVAEGTTLLHHPVSPQNSQHESFYSAGSHPAEADDTASNYGALDPTDMHRLSFISFADVVQAEQAESLHHAGPMSASSLGLTHTYSSPSASSFGHALMYSPPLPCSPSPTRSPLSSQGLTTPPPGSDSTSIQGFDMSPVRSPVIAGPQQHGELTIETMRQALTGAKMVPYPVGFEDGGLERHGSR